MTEPGASRIIGEGTSSIRHHLEEHSRGNISALRAAVLGANDGIVSTASLIVGVAASTGSQTSILIAGAAGLVAGAMSMAAGEYVSVSSQADSEVADLRRETVELRDDWDAEVAELAGIYVSRGLTADLAEQVALQLMAKDALGSHARDELGMSDSTNARPLQAAITSAASFTVGAVPPLAVAYLAPGNMVIPAVAMVSLMLLALLGALGGMVGRANILRATVRVSFWGILAMIVTAGIGRLFA
jgi:VIT1/CCC1 family predicted Fe2+/Mn2+ transporter